MVQRKRGRKPGNVKQTVGIKGEKKLKGIRTYGRVRVHVPPIVFKKNDYNEKQDNSKNGGEKSRNKKRSIFPDVEHSDEESSITIKKYRINGESSTVKIPVETARTAVQTYMPYFQERNLNIGDDFFNVNFSQENELNEVGKTQHRISLGRSSSTLTRIFKQVSTDKKWNFTNSSPSSFSNNDERCVPGETEDIGDKLGKVECDELKIKETSKLVEVETLSVKNKDKEVYDVPVFPVTYNKDENSKLNELETLNVEKKKEEFYITPTSSLGHNEEKNVIHKINSKDKKLHKTKRNQYHHKKTLDIQRFTKSTYRRPLKNKQMTSNIPGNYNILDKPAKYPHDSDDEDPLLSGFGEFANVSGK